MPQVMHEELLQRKGPQEFRVVDALIMLQKNRLHGWIFGLWIHDILGRVSEDVGTRKKEKEIMRTVEKKGADSRCDYFLPVNWVTDSLLQSF